MDGGGPKVRVTILGCGGSGGVPLIGGPDGHGDWGACDPAEPRNRRTRSSILIEALPLGGRLLVDAGPDLRQQLLANGIGRVDAILFTHAHADHIFGVDEVRQLNRVQRRAIPAYGMEQTMDTLRTRFDYAFLPPSDRGFFRPALDARVVKPGDRLQVAGMEARLFLQDHKVMETLGLRVGGFAYSTDVVELPEESWAALEGVDTWVVGCFQREPHPVHAHVAKVLGWAERLRPRRTVLTHMGTDLDWGWLARTLPPGVEAAHDGMVLEVGTTPG